MNQLQPDTTMDNLKYIDLDDPRSLWATLFGALAIIVIIAVLIAPWTIDWSSDDSDSVVTSATTRQSTGSVCRPDASGLPTWVNPTVASWGRFCDWFIAPEIESPNGQ